MSEEDEDYDSRWLEDNQWIEDMFDRLDLGEPPSSNLKLIALAEKAIAAFKSDPIDMTNWAARMAKASAQFND